MPKYLRQQLHFALVWITIALLAVDPAAACRLFGGRRCHACRTAVPSCSEMACSDAVGFDVACSDALPAFEMPQERVIPEPSPSDRPPLPNSEPRTTAAPPPADVTATAPQPAPLAPAAPAPMETVRPIETPTAQPATGRTAPPKRAAPATTTPPATFAPPAARSPQVESARPANSTPPASIAAPSVPNSPPPMPPRTPPASSAPRPAAPITPPTFPPVDDDPFAPPPAASSKKKASIPAPPAPATPVSDDPFAPLPSSTTAPKAAAPENDDPFAPLPATPPAASRPKVASPTAVNANEKLANVPQLGADGRLLVREWADSSGVFRVQARLVLILDGKVRLLKETGRTTTVPVERLSPSDRAYVTEVVARYGSDLTQLDQLAAR